MTIQWFPGHMAKARREISGKLKLVDIIFELLDARIPYSSSNPMIEEMIHQKRRIVVLNKADIADEKITKAWINYFKQKKVKAIAVNSQQGKNMHTIEKAATELMAEKFERLKKKGMNPPTIRAMIVGIPNVGKSTLINRLAKKNIAKTGNKPGVTKAQQWIKIGNKLELLDTPGVLWPKFEDPEVGYKLALTGAIKDDLLNMVDVAQYGLQYLQQFYPEKRPDWFEKEQYKENPIKQLEIVAKKEKLFDRYQEVDYERSAEVVVRKIRQQKWGRVSFDRPEIPE